MSDVDAPDDLTIALQQAANAAVAGDRSRAVNILVNLPPAPPSKKPKPSGAVPRAAPQTTSLRRQTRRNVAKSVYLGTYFRDSFTCRYCGRYTVFLQVMTSLSKLFPAEFPTHPNWKLGECHPAYWTHTTTLEHVVPVARGGEPRAAGNLVTACYACQHTKGTRLLEELGWSLVPPQQSAWDGLIGLYPALCELAGLSSDRWHRGWLTELAPSTA